MADPQERLIASLADRYPIEREIGRGGMATVYLAQDVRHGRQVAVKVLNPELGAVLGAERFLREIEIVAKLSHPHILPLYDSGQVDGVFYYVMPLIEGESLRDRLNRERQLPVDEAIRLARQVATALEYAHRRNIIHRDIKPENVLLHEGVALVADFGIALAVSAAGGERITGTGLSLGTPYYMSPEQAMGEKQIDARSDIYSLGCMLYEMLAGEPPFSAATSQGIVAAILTERPRPLRVRRESVSPALEAVVMKALARLPADRYVSALKLDEALARVATEPWSAGTTEGLAVARAVEQPPTRVGAQRRFARSIPWIVAGLALGVAAAGWLRPRPEARSASLAPGEISTEALQQLLAEGSVLVLDSRPHLEYSISHIPGARNVAARPGVPQSMYVSDVAEVNRIVGGDLAQAIVLYCNGPHCPKSKRLGDELANAGHTDVRRYQLGIPVWRAMGGVTVIEADGLRHVIGRDQTAVLLDVREADDFRRGSLPGARNVPRSGVLEARDVGELRKAKDDGRLPMFDHNTRIIVVGATEADARFVAQAIALEAFHNVAYFPGSFAEARAALAR